MELEFGLWRIVYARVQKFADAVRGDAETAAIEKVACALESKYS